MKPELWKLEDIKPYANNPKAHNVPRIAASLRDFGIDQPIVVDGDGVIIKGHGRLKAAHYLKLKEFWVIQRTDLTPEQVRKSRLADNRVGEGGWIPELLELETEETGAMPEYGFDEEFLDSLILKEEQEEDERDSEDDEPETITVPILIEVTNQEMKSLREFRKEQGADTWRDLFLALVEEVKNA